MPKNKNELILPKELAEKARNEKILSLLGLAMKAGRLSLGCDRVCDEIRRHGLPSEDENETRRAVGLVVVARDASANTKKRITNACTYYNVNFYISDITSDALAERLGKSSSAAVCATFDRGFADGIKKAVASFGGAGR